MIDEHSILVLEDSDLALAYYEQEKELSRMRERLALIEPELKAFQGLSIQLLQARVDRIEIEIELHKTRKIAQIFSN